MIKKKCPRCGGEITECESCFEELLVDDDILCIPNMGHCHFNCAQNCTVKREEE